MKEYYFFYLAFFLGLLWFYKKTKKKEIYHYYTILFVLFLNLNYPPFNFTRNTQWSLILMMTGCFALFDLSYVKKIKGVWRYTIPAIIYGIYLIMVK